MANLISTLLSIRLHVRVSTRKRVVWYHDPHTGYTSYVWVRA